MYITTRKDEIVNFVPCRQIKKWNKSLSTMAFPHRTTWARKAENKLWFKLESGKYMVGASQSLKLPIKADITITLFEKADPTRNLNKPKHKHGEPLADPMPESTAKASTDIAVAEPNIMTTQMIDLDGLITMTTRPCRIICEKSKMTTSRAALDTPVLPS